MHTFCSSAHCADGYYPYFGLIQGSDGNFYGMTTYGGGAQSECISGVYGCGTIYKITPTGMLTTLHDFCTVGTAPDCADGALPYAMLVQGSDFNFYGVAAGGGPTFEGGVGEGIFFVLAALPVAGVSPSTLTFASQDEGTTSSPQAVTLSNRGQEALTVPSIVPSGDFSQSDNCGGSVAVGSSCTIEVTFTPTQTGIRTGTLTISDNNHGISTSQQAVSLTGTGANPHASLSATSLAFADQAIHTTSSAKNITLTSSGATPLTNITIAIIGTNFADFNSTYSCPGTLNVGSKCIIKVTFTPSLLTAESATLQVSDNAANTPQTVALGGIGITDATLTPASTNFGSVPENASSSARKFTLKNNQPVALGTLAIGFSGTNEGDFFETDTCGSSLKAKSVCTISVTLTPSLVGAESATLTVSSNAPAPYNALTSALSGTGIAQATISPTSISYRAQTVGTTSAAHNVTLKNNLSTAVTVAGFGFTGADPGDFSVSATTCGASLAAKSTCTVSVVFQPEATGTRAATLNVNDSASNSPQTVSLTGTAR